MTLVRFEMHVNGVEGGEDGCLPVETEPCPGSFKLLPFTAGSNGGDQDGEVANAKRNTILDGTWVTATKRARGCRGRKKRRSEFDNDRAEEIGGRKASVTYGEGATGVCIGLEEITHP